MSHTCVTHVAVLTDIEKMRQGERDRVARGTEGQESEPILLCVRVHEDVCIDLNFPLRWCQQTMRLHKNVLLKSGIEISISELEHDVL